MENNLHPCPVIEESMIENSKIKKYVELPEIDCLKVSFACRKCGQDRITGALNWHLGTANIPSPITSHSSSPLQKHLF